MTAKGTPWVRIPFRISPEAPREMSQPLSTPHSPPP